MRWLEVTRGQIRSEQVLSRRVLQYTPKSLWPDLSFVFWTADLSKHVVISYFDLTHLIMDLCANWINMGVCACGCMWLRQTDVSVECLQCIFTSVQITSSVKTLSNHSNLGEILWTVEHFAGSWRNDAASVLQRLSDNGTFVTLDNLSMNHVMK